MNKKIVLILGCFAMLFVVAENNDAEVKRIIEYSSRIDDGHASESEMRYAMRVCGYDTNRFMRVMQELAVENPALKEYIIAEICSFGNSSALPFLYQNVTNSTSLKVGMYAAMAILEIEGITSNSIAKVDQFLKMSQNNKIDGSQACCWLVRYAARPSVEPKLKALALCRAVEYASINNYFPDRVDMAIVSSDPTYRMSRRRLAALRAVTTLGVSPRCTNYVATAINELVAYPEANLPE